MRYINTTDENITFTDVNGRVAIVPKNRVYTHFNVDTITFLLVERYESEGICLFTTRAEDLQINGVVYTFEQLLSGEGIGEMYSPTGLTIKLVDELPQSGEDSTIYLVPNDKGSYTEYIWLKDNNKWEELGDITKIDLSNYYTKAEINAMFADYYTQSEIDDMFDGYYTKTEVDEALNLKANVDDVYDKTTADSTFATQVVVNQEIASRIQADTELQEQINAKADKSDTYTKEQVDTAITTAVNSIDLTPYETIADHNQDVQDLEDAIALKADATALDDYATVASVESELSVINGTISQLSDVVDTKADADDVYTKQEVDAEINNTNQITSEAITSLKDIIVDNERTTTEALNDLENRKTDKSELANYTDKKYVDDNFIPNTRFDKKEETISRALTELHKTKADKSEIPDVSSYPTTSDLNTALQAKQDVLTAGENITIENNVISATGGGSMTQVQSDWNQSDNTAVDFIKNKPTIPVVPTTVSSFTNDAGYLTQHQSLSNYYTKTEIDNMIGDVETLLAAL